MGFGLFQAFFTEHLFLTKLLVGFIVKFSDWYEVKRENKEVGLTSKRVCLFVCVVCYYFLIEILCSLYLSNHQSSLATIIIYLCTVGPHRSG